MIDNDKLKDWFEQHKRELPWRENPTPYRVWISETMLQQTQVETVWPYFLKWMTQFPTISDLAAAPLEKVIKMWEGLGYYSRARNLHKGALLLVEKFNGQLSPEALDELPGVGPYTKGAILSFAFKQKAAAIDGNVARVLSRLWAIEAPIDKARTKKQLSEKLQLSLPDEEPWVAQEALIELGALVCRKNKPTCQLCPLKKSCQAYTEDKVQRLPFKERKIKIERITKYVAVIFHQDRVLIQKKGQKERMADLYEFPSNESEDSLTQQLDCNLANKGFLKPHRQAYTRYLVELKPILFYTDSQPPIGEWVYLSQLAHYPFSSGHKRIGQSLIEMEENISRLMTEHS